MSEDDEFEQELRRIQQLEEMTKDTGPELIPKKAAPALSSQASSSANSTPHREDTPNNNHANGSGGGSVSRDKTESEGSADEKFMPYLRRVTRKSTGSLPKEKKTLLEETTEELDERIKAKAKKPTKKPGMYTVLAPECTACGSDVVLRPYQRRMLIHPYVKAAICRQCHEFYHSDVFEIDDEGSEVYCIWCGEGGKLSYCDRCEKAFCADCLRRNFGKKTKNEILAMEKWECYICKPNEEMLELRKIAEMVTKYQNACVKDDILIRKFECDVTKEEMVQEDYQRLVSERIKTRAEAKLLSSSQQNAAEEKSSSENEEDKVKELDRSKSPENGDASDDSEHSNYSTEKRKRNKLNGRVKGRKMTESASSSTSSSDDEEFLNRIRSQATDRKENTSSVKFKSNSQKGSGKSSNKENESSDDSLFDTDNPNIKAKNIRKRLESSDDMEGALDSDENDEMVQKYREKLSKYEEKAIQDEAGEDADKSDDESEFTSESDSSEGENGTKSSTENDSDTTEKGDGSKEKKQKKRKAQSDGEQPKKKKRKKRSKKEDGDSGDAEDGSSDSGEEKDDAKKDKKGKRKKIRKIMGVDQLQKSTVEAQEAEELRRKKIKEKALPSQQGKILNFILEDLRKEKNRNRAPTFEEVDQGKVIEVHHHLKRRLKPHQMDGIQFMYDCCIESAQKVINGSPGSGCILAHCMGLGKSFQVVSFLTTVLNYHFIFGLKRAIVVCPLNTVRNWNSEFHKWLRDLEDAPEVFMLSDNINSNEKRAEILENWYETSGVLIIGYALYRILSQGAKIRKKSLKDDFKKYLVDPGPDICVCDEGHIIKNEKTGISKALNSMKTKRRVILTGTPLQNNLVEYHCMVSFVKPNLLGTIKEFKNMYENPINNGQCVDATEKDIRLMKERSHILYEQLSACVQRRDYNVLKEFLPLKYEYVLSIKLSDLQVKLYQKYLEQLSGNQRLMSKLFECYQNLKKIWTHPWLLELDANKNDRNSLADFITDGETSESWEASSDDSEFKVKKKKKKKEEKKEEKKDNEVPDATAEQQAVISSIANELVPAPENVDPHWFKGEISDKDEKMLEHSGKLLVTLEILDKASQKGEKVLLFSQSLLALDFLETTINRVGWSKGRDYFRMDGSTKTANRSLFQKKFNDKTNKRCRLFLISTKAGGLGINLVAANRIILFDMSWNPSDDTQSLFRSYRYGQTKNVYVYRLVARGTMEEKIYDRQVFKESLSSRVVDEKQISRYFSTNDLQELFSFDPSQQTCTTSVLANHNPPSDDILASLLVDLDPPLVLEYHEHDSLLEHRPEQQLTEEERKAAWENFKADKQKRNTPNTPSLFQRLKAHTQTYVGPMITPIYSNQQELILGGFTNEQILSIQQQLESVVKSGQLSVKDLGRGQLHIVGLAPEQQQIFIQSIRDQQRQQIIKAQEARIAKILPQQEILQQMSVMERTAFQQQLQLLMQQQQVAQLQYQQQLAHQQQQMNHVMGRALPTETKPPALTLPTRNTTTPILITDEPPPPQAAVVPTKSMVTPSTEVIEIDDSNDR